MTNTIIKQENWVLSDLTHSVIMIQTLQNKFIVYYQQGRNGQFKTFGFNNKSTNYNIALQNFQKQIQQLKQKGYKLKDNIITQYTGSQKNIKKISIDKISNKNILSILQKESQLPLNFEFIGYHVHKNDTVQQHLSKKSMFNKKANQYYFKLFIFIIVSFNFYNVYQYNYADIYKFLFVFFLTMILVGLFSIFIYYKSIQALQLQTTSEGNKYCFYGITGGILYYYEYTILDENSFAFHSPSFAKKFFLFHLDQVVKIKNELLITEKNEVYTLNFSNSVAANLLKYIEKIKNSNV